MKAIVALAAAAMMAPPGWLWLATTDVDAVPDAGRLEWTQRLPGFETAELEVLMRGQKVDLMHLVRFDPKRYGFEVLHDAVAPTTIDEWQQRTGALAVVNGSFYEMDYQPQTPLRSRGRRLGPSRYASGHGAFVANDGRAEILDLKGRSVDEAIRPFPEAMVSYPLLFDETGRIRAGGRAAWLASRTFVGIDRKGRVILGTTETGFFSLRRLARFLRAAPLDLKTALNFDGGPPACQIVEAGGFHKAVHGRWELNDSTGELRMYWGAEEIRDWKLPIVLAVVPRSGGGGESR